MQSDADPKSYTIKSTTGTLGKYANVKDFTAEKLNMDKNSIMVNAKNSADVYYNYNNKVWRWGLTAEPSASPVNTIVIPEGVYGGLPRWNRREPPLCSYIQRVDRKG